MTIVINLLGGPGTSKSTVAAELYAKMKRKYMNVEMVREVAKEWAWSGRQIGPFEQIAIIGEQIQKESSLFGKVKYIVTDSPVLLGAVYADENHGISFMSNTVKNYYNFCEEKKVKHLNFVLPPFIDYDEEGRFESRDDAMYMHYFIMQYLDENHYTYLKLEHDNISDTILERI